MSTTTKLLKNTAKAIAHAVTANVDDVKIPAYVCLQDIKRRDAENELLYSLVQLSAGEALLAHIEDVYIQSNVYLNYRKKFIAVKVNKPQFRDKVSVRAAKLDLWCEANGIVIEHTRHGNMVYRANADVLDNLLLVTAE
jgi:hypothetical protein